MQERVGNYHRVGAPIELPEGSVQIKESDGRTVQFSFTNLIQEGKAIELSVKHQQSIGDVHCERCGTIFYGDSIDFTAICFDGYTDVNLYAYVGDEESIEGCEACRGPVEDSIDWVAYYFELNCEHILEQES